MVKIETHLRELFEGEVDGGRDFYWAQDSKIVLSQEWNHKASGRVWEEVESHEYNAEDMAQYITADWPEYKIVNVIKLSA